MKKIFCQKITQPALFFILLFLKSFYFFSIMIIKRENNFFLCHMHNPWHLCVLLLCSTVLIINSKCQAKIFSPAISHFFPWKGQKWWTTLIYLSSDQRNSSHSILKHSGQTVSIRTLHLLQFNAYFLDFFSAFFFFLVLLPLVLPFVLWHFWGLNILWVTKSFS